MTGEEQIHELLPWYLTRTLEAAEAEAFRDHLAACPRCREEMAVLKKVRDAAQKHGPAFFSEHPEADRLVAAIRGELNESEAAEIRQHLALCVTCATESRWITGELTADVEVPRQPGGEARAEPRRVRGWRLPLTAAVAALVLVGVLVTVPRGSYTGVVHGHYLTPTERGSGEAVLVSRPTGGAPLVLVLEVAYPPSAFPVEVEIVDDAGRPVIDDVSAQHEDLFEELYLILKLDPRDFPTGSYTVRVRPSAGGLPQLESRFEITD